jgi:sialate O-acetylesterase
MSRRCFAVACAVGLLAAGVAQADVRLPAIMGSGMVIQRDKPVPIWGFADAGESVRVEMKGQVRTTAADAAGKWRVLFDPIAAEGKPLQITVAGKANKLTIDDVLVGEVWICGGQSNMELRVRLSTTGKETAASLASGPEPAIRLFKLEHAAADTPQDDCVGTWQHPTPEAVGEFAAAGFFFGRDIQKAVGVPVGLIQPTWGGTPCESWTSDAVLRADPEGEPLFAREREQKAAMPAAIASYNEKLAAWQRENANRPEKERARKPLTPAQLYDAKYPCVLYNGMIAPIAGYAARGVIWYQGEANATRAFQYRKLLPLMIGDWRRAWGDDQLPFCMVQLPGFGPITADAVEPAPWAELREAQAIIAAKTPNVGMIAAIDLGESENTHPKRKQQVGERLARWALANVYHHTDLVWTAPTYRAMKVEGSRVRLSFEHNESPIKTADGGKVTGFAIAGADNKFVDAEATIEGAEIVVWSASVTQPTSVRYAWKAFPICNMVNAEGLPMSPFRTDSLPCLSDDKH